LREREARRREKHRQQGANDHRKKLRMVPQETMPRDPVVVAIVLNWNGWIDTVECVESLLRSVRLPDYIVVCDNGSKDDSLERMREWADGLLVVETALGNGARSWAYRPAPKPLPYTDITSPEALLAPHDAPHQRLIFADLRENVGYAAGNNAGMRFATDRLQADYVWLLNNDTVIDRHALERQLELAESDRSIGMVGSKLLMYRKPDTIQALGGGYLLPLIAHDTQIGRGRKVSSVQNVPFDLDHIVGASLFVRAQAIRDAGFIDESYFLYREETDWCIEMRRRGWRLVCCPGATIWHKEASSLGMRSGLHDYYALRNMLYMIRKHHAATLPTAWLYFLLRALAPKLARLQFRRIGYVLRAYYDFARGVRGRCVFHGDERPTRVATPS
jgi:GT2 family glycosyltransferase